MAKFTNQQPWTVTKEDETRPWSGKSDGSNFRCYLCGHKFKEGDVCRWVYSNGPQTPHHGGNFFVCINCDGADVLDRAAKHFEESKSKYWWLWRE